MEKGMLGVDFVFFIWQGGISTCGRFGNSLKTVQLKGIGGVAKQVHKVTCSKWETKSTPTTNPLKNRVKPAGNKG